MPQPTFVQLVLGALLFERQTYEAMRDDPQGLRRGALLILIVGLLGGAASAIGGILTGLINPNPRELGALIATQLSTSAWFSSQPAALRENFSAEALSDVFALFTPTVGGALLALVTTPLFGLLSWLIGGLFGHMIAKLFGGKGTLSATMRTTALANAPQIFGLSLLAPVLLVSNLINQNVATLGLAVPLATSLMSLTAFAVAIQTSHQLGWRGSLGATLALPLLLIVLFGCIFTVFVVGTLA